MELNRKILVAGVGGGGINALNSLIDSNLPDIEYCAMGTDKQLLENSLSPCKILLGSGLGCGGDMKLGYKCVQEARGDIETMLNGFDIAIIVTSLGGGTGGGATPVIANIAKTMGILTICIATTPFTFEGKKRSMQALESVKKLKECTDSLFIIKNDIIMEHIETRTSFKDAFKIVDNIISAITRRILDVTYGSYSKIIFSFEDVKKCFENAKISTIGFGKSDDIENVQEAIDSAINSKFHYLPLNKAKKIILAVSGGNDLTLHHLGQAANALSGIISPEAEIYVHCTSDETLTGKIEVTVIGLDYDENDDIPPANVFAELK